MEEFDEYIHYTQCERYPSEYLQGTKRKRNAFRVSKNAQSKPVERIVSAVSVKDVPGPGSVIG